jgi:hypothetical protein
LSHARFVFNLTNVLPWAAAPEDGASPSHELHVATLSPICWRLLSPNNRQLGRSAEEFGDLTGCRRAVEAFVLGLDASEALLTRHMGPVRWTWRVLQGNLVVARSGRSFETKRQAARTLDNFLSSAPLALITPDLMNLHVGRGEATDRSLPA